jgi:hypothetical protein
MIVIDASVIVELATTGRIVSRLIAVCVSETTRSVVSDTQTAIFGPVEVFVPPYDVKVRL